MPSASHKRLRSSFLVFGKLLCFLLALRVRRVFGLFMGALWGVRGVRHFGGFVVKKGGGGRISQI